MTETPKTEILATIHASGARRVVGVGMLAGLGALLVWIAFVQPPEVLFWQIFLLVLGGLSLALAEKMRRATLLRLELTEELLRDSDGAVVARITDIASIDRGTFAFKPSNGFILRLKTSQPRRWLPGLWWRMGRRVGIGGVTPGSQSRFMAEVMQDLVTRQGMDD